MDRVAVRRLIAYSTWKHTMTAANSVPPAWLRVFPFPHHLCSCATCQAFTWRRQRSDARTSSSRTISPIVMLDAQLSIASERISYDWVSESSSERVRMRRIWLPVWVKSITNSEPPVRLFGFSIQRRRIEQPQSWNSSSVIIGTWTSAVEKWTS